MKRLLKIVGGVVALLLGVALALPFLIDPNRFRPMLETELSQALGRGVTLGDLKLSILGGSVTAGDLAIADDPAFSKAPFVKAKSLAIEVKLWPLITSRKLQVVGLKIEQPTIALIQGSSGRWNFSTLGGKSEKRVEAAAAPSSGDLDVSVQLLKISGGELSMSHLGEKNKPLALHDVDIDVRDFSAATEFPFTMRAKVAGGGSIALDGKAGPLHKDDMEKSPLTASLKIDGLDLVGSGLAQNTPALAGVVNFQGDGRAENAIAHVTGKLRATNLKLAQAGTPAKKPVEFTFALDHDINQQTGRLKKGDLSIGKAIAHLTGSYRPSGETTALNMDLNGPSMDVDELVEMLPPMAVVLPRGSKLKGGTASAKVSVDGPLNRLVTNGAFSLDGAKLTDFDLGRKLEFVETLAGIPSTRDTDIRTLRSTVNMGPEGIKVDDMELDIPTIGNVTGAGTVSPANELAFLMLAKVKGLSVPFRISGPAAEPSFRPEVKTMVKEAAKDTVKGFLKGILGGKK